MKPRVYVTNAFIAITYKRPGLVTSLNDTTLYISSSSSSLFQHLLLERVSDDVTTARPLPRRERDRKHRQNRLLPRQIAGLFAVSGQLRFE